MNLFTRTPHPLIKTCWRPTDKTINIMRLIVLLTLLCCFKVSASVYAQKISIDVKDVPIESVFDQIKKQIDYTFWYKDDVLLATKKVTINFKKFDLEEALTACLKDQPLIFEITGKIIVIKPKTFNQQINPFKQIEIKGIVLDEKGKPLPNATIKIKNANQKLVISGSDGKFAISASNDDILVISYVGYKTKEINVNSSNNNIVVSLELLDNKLNEVEISTGIFKKADKSFTGSSTTVTAKELQQFGNRNLIVSLRNIDPSFNIIESNTAGSNPNRLPDIQIRGNSSLPNLDNLDNLAGLNTPLVILDGFQSSLEKMLDINVNEVLSVTILKDAAATAMYGSRGSNGVIVITTKQPAAGKLRIAYRADLNLENADLSDYTLLDARQKLDLEQKLGFYNNANAADDIKLKTYYNYLLNEVNRSVNTNWLELPLHTGVGQRHNLSLSGGDDAFRYGISAQVNNIEGVMKGSARNTFNGTVNLAYIFKNIRFSNQTAITEGKSSESSYGSFSDYAKMNPYWRPFDDKGNAIKILGDPGNDSYKLRWSQLPTNPLYNATLNVFDKTKKSELINNTSIELVLLEGLKARAQFGVIKSEQQTDKFRPAEHTAFANYSVADVFRKGDYNYGISNGFSYDGSLNLQYSKIFNKKHTLFAGLDYNMRSAQNSAYSFLAEGFSNSNFDFISMALQYANGQKPNGSENLTKAIGVTSNVNYIYDDRFFADASLRMDGSSQFGKNNKLAPFWSVGLGWNLHNEAFLKDNQTINRLKIRGSVGVTGSQNFNAYQALSTYRYYTNDRYFSWNSAYLLGIGNEDLKWQQALKYDIGFNAELLQGRIQLTGDYYISETRDLLSSIGLPASSGFPSYIENVGKMTNKGFELKGTGILTKNPSDGLFWSVSLGVFQNRNKIVQTSKALKDAQKNRQIQETDVLNALYFEGYSTNTIWVVPSLGIDPSNGKEVYLDINGKATYIWSGNDIRALGNSDPDFMGSFSTMFKYKSFSLNAAFGYRFGGQLYNQTLISKVENADYKYNVDSRVYSDRWTQPGDNVAFKGLMVLGNTNRSSRFVQDENTITCQNINLEYVIKSNYIKQKLRLSNLQVSANVADPFRFSTIKQERGTTYPFSKQYSLSISATF